MAAVVDIDVLTAQLGINWSDVNLDSIQLPPGNDFGIERWDFFHYISASIRIFVSNLRNRLVFWTDCVDLFLWWLGSDDESVYQDDQSEFDTGFGNIIVVDHLPVVPKEKFEKLEGVVKKIYNQLGVIKENGLLMPVDPDTKMTLGYCFIEFNTPQVVYLLAA